MNKLCHHALSIVVVVVVSTHSSFRSNLKRKSSPSSPHTLLRNSSSCQRANIEFLNFASKRVVDIFILKMDENVPKSNIKLSSFPHVLVMLPGETPLLPSSCLPASHPLRWWPVHSSADQTYNRSIWRSGGRWLSYY